MSAKAGRVPGLGSVLRGWLRLVPLEAFVSGAGKGHDHVDDARLAVAAFVQALPDPPAANAVRCQSPVFSLAGAALLRTGWSADLALQRQPCLVIRARSAGVV